jgi:hypothetical protein
LNSLPFRPWFCILYGQVARDLLSNGHIQRRAIGLSSFRRNLSLQGLSREPESRLLLTAFWIPACAGMTDQHLSEKGNLDKTEIPNQLSTLAGNFALDSIFAEEYFVFVLSHCTLLAGKTINP